MLKKAKETVEFLKSQFPQEIDFALILGSGLGQLADEIEVEYKVNYRDIPNFPVSTVEGHSGNLVFGKFGGKTVMAMQGRFHFYEGYDMSVVTFPIRVMKLMGIDNLIVSNASGGVRAEYSVGDILIIKDHINMIPEHPLRGKNIDELGPRFVDMSEAYDREYIKIAKEAASDLNIKVQEGIYLALQGPTFETPAEYKMVKLLGADCVGMSTAPEVIVAKHMGMRCFGLSVITDLGVEGSVVEVSHEEVQEAAQAASPKMIDLVRTLIERV